MKSYQYQQQQIPTKTLNALEQDIILFFVQTNQKRIELKELLKVIFDRYRTYLPIEIMDSIVKLCKYEFFFLTSDTILVVDNIPLIIQTVMRFKRQITAYLLYYLVKQNSFAIRRNEPAIFDYKKIFYLPKLLEDKHIYKVYELYYEKDLKLWVAMNELKRKGYLIKIGKSKYNFRYDLLPVEIRRFLV